MTLRTWHSWQVEMTKWPSIQARPTEEVTTKGSDGILSQFQADVAIEMSTICKFLITQSSMIARRGAATNMAMAALHSSAFEARQTSAAAAASSCAQLLWKQHFIKPSQLLDNRNSTHTDPTSTRWEMLSLDHVLASLEHLPHPPSLENLASILLKCRKVKNPSYALRLHAYLRKSGLEAHRFLGNYLVPMLVEVGSIRDAQHVFNRLVDRNEHSWTSLITGYIEIGELKRAFMLYQKMQEASIYPSAHTFVALMKTCARLKDPERGRQIHAQIARHGFLETNPFVGSTLIDMYAKCGVLAKAQEVFDELPVRVAVSWNALIAGYAEQGIGQEALSRFEQMQLEGIFPSAITFVCSLKACGSIGTIDKGQEIYAQIAKKGLLEIDPFVGNILVDMFAKCSSLAKAQEVFDKLPVRDEVSWNALIAGYTQHGLGQEALNCFEQMQLEGFSPNAITFVGSLKACHSIGAIGKGREIHAQIAKGGLLESHPFVGNTLVDMYAKWGLLAKAQEVFDKLPVRDAVSWTALIAGYAEHGLGQESLNCFEQMEHEGITPDAITYVGSLKACGSIGAIVQGQEIHAQIAKKGLLERDPFLGNSLVDMYAKCGLLAKAQEVFDKLLVRDAVSWTALIAGYADLGDSENIFCILERMRAEGIKPNGVTFLIILTACSHTGLVDKGQTYFEAMTKDYGITPTIEHHICMVDLLGRAGQLDKAVVMIKKMPFNPNLALWHTVLGACWKWGNAELGRWAFEHAMKLDEKDAAAYVLMSNIYADAHMQMRLKEQAWKKPGESWWTDVDRVVHSFLVGNTRHSRNNYI